MFDREKIRYWIAGVWLLLFILMWYMLDFYLLPRQKMVQKIESLESHIIAEDWPNAKEDMKQLNDTWYKNKVFIQVSTGSDEVFTFEQLLGQTEGLVMTENDDALDFVSGIKVMKDYVSKAFPGP